MLSNRYVEEPYIALDEKDTQSTTSNRLQSKVRYLSQFLLPVLVNMGKYEVLKGDSQWAV